MRYISIDSAQPGMIVGKSIYNEQGSILVNYRVKLTERLISRMRDIGVRRHIVGGTYRTLISVQNPLRLCRTGICRSLSAG